MANDDDHPLVRDEQERILVLLEAYQAHIKHYGEIVKHIKAGVDLREQYGWHPVDRTPGFEWGDEAEWPKSQGKKKKRRRPPGPSNN